MTVIEQDNRPPNQEFSLGITVDILPGSRTNWESDIDFARSLGVAHVELWMEHLPDGGEISRIRRALGGLSCTAHAPFVDVSLATIDPEFAKISLDRLSRTIGVCIELGARAIAIHSGKCAVYEDKGEVLRRIAHRYHTLQQNSAADIPLGLENLKEKSSGVSREPISSLEDMRFLKSLNPGVNFTLDLGHAIQNRIDPAVLLSEFGNSSRHVHLHDSAPTGRSHRALGNGDLNVQSVLGTLEEATVPRYVTLELLSRSDYEISITKLSDIAAARALIRPKMKSQEFA